MWNSALSWCRRPRVAVLVLSLVRFEASREAAATLLIDNFSTPQSLVANTDDFVPIFDGDPTGGNSVGGARAIALNADTSPVTQAQSLIIDDGGNGLLNLTFNSADTPRGTLNYTGETTGNDLTPGLGIDLSTTPIIEISSRATVVTGIDLTVYTSASQWSVWTFTIPGNGVMGAFDSTMFDLSANSPSLSSGGGAILMSVAGLSFVISDGEVPPGSVVQLDYIQATAVPEASAVAMMAVALAGSVGVAKVIRRRSSS